MDCLRCEHALVYVVHRVHMSAQSSLLRRVVRQAVGIYFRRWKGASQKHPARSPVYKVQLTLQCMCVLLCVCVCVWVCVCICTSATSATSV